MTEAYQQPPPIAWSSPGLAAIARFLLADTGLLFSETRRASAESGIGRAMLRVGVRSHSILLERMRSEPAVLDEVLAELTIGETYFLRDREQLNFIINTAVATRASGADASRPLRIWSAGCSSGEEPYSIAIMAHESGIRPAPHIVGTDIATGRLAKARRGRYGNWSFRGVPDEIRHRYFREDGRNFLLDSRIRETVSFQLLNLAEDAYPSPVSGIFGMDIILCRNVLIYFDKETVERVAARLIDCLADGGWLFVGASDPMLGEVCGCEVRMTPAGIAYRRVATRGKSRAGGPTVAPAPLVRAAHVSSVSARDDRIATISQDFKLPTLPASVALGAATDAYSRGDYAEAARIANEEFVAGRGTAALAVLEVRCVANLGDVADGIALCAQRLETHREVAELHYLHAVLLMELGLLDDATAAARSATYLDASLAVAHLALGDASSRAGNDAVAHREYRVAAELLAAMPGDAAVPGADGETALRLLHIAQFRLRAIAEGRMRTSNGAQA